MEVEFSVSLIELKLAFLRMLSRLPDESDAGSEFVIFEARGDSLEIVAQDTVEGLPVSIVHSGRASVPSAVFSGLARVLRFYRHKTVRFAFSAGVVKIDHTEFRHPGISASSIFTLTGMGWTRST
jgi:hypothetical protein